MTEERRIEEHWHLDKKVPIALIMAILLQTGAALWWASAITSRVDRLEQSSRARDPLPERVTRLEVIVEQIPRTLDRIESKLDMKLDKK